MSATIKDVARVAGVSVATVSRVLNHSATVSVSATEQVNMAIKELGYSPNFLGRNLRRCETNVILAIIPSTEQTFYSGIIRGMQNAASERGYDILLGASNGTYDLEMRLLNMLFNRTADAAILLGTQLDAETLMDLNDKYYIALCCERSEGADVLTVTVDDEGGAYAAIDYLIKCGHTKIGMLSTVVSAASSFDRENGYKRALQDNGIEFRKEYIYKGGYEFHHGASGFEYLMKLPEPPTAIFCVSDILAASVVKKALSEGYKVGEDISVCGFDNIIMSDMYTPGITTVEQPCYEIGRAVVEELISNISSETKSNKKIALPYKLIERETVKNMK